MAKQHSMQDWQQVPDTVAALLPQALQIKEAHVAAAAVVDCLATSALTWNPTTQQVNVYHTAPVTEDVAQKYAAAFSAADCKVTHNGVAQFQPDTDVILIKRGSLIPGLPTVWNTSNKLLLGPTPLSNGIVASLLGGGLGYGAGALAENLFPARYLERGKLRRTLGLVGALGGVGLAGLQGYANARALKTNFMRGLVTNNKTPVPYMDQYEKRSYGNMLDGTGAIVNDPMLSPSIYVPQFNNAVWNDARRGNMFGYSQHTPPAYAAATAGLMSGISTMNRSPIIRPIDVVRGIASAGVGLATANVVGKTLSALAGLSPAGQNKLQEIGLWGGVMHAIVPPLFGVR